LLHFPPQPQVLQKRTPQPNRPAHGQCGVGRGKSHLHAMTSTALCLHKSDHHCSIFSPWVVRTVPKSAAWSQHAIACPFYTLGITAWLDVDLQCVTMPTKSPTNKAPVRQQRHQYTNKASEQHWDPCSATAFAQ